MQRIRASQVVGDILGGTGDQELREKYKLSAKGLQRLLQKLVDEKAIDHADLYERSITYRHVADLLALRRSQRVPVPVAIRASHYRTSQKGFVRDISENGLRIAGIEAEVGDTMTLCLPLEEIDNGRPIEFEVVCRWSETKGKSMRYVVSGFEITSISADAKSRLNELMDLAFRQNRKGPVISDEPLDTSALLRSASAMRRNTPSRRFSGELSEVDILDIVQFVLLNRIKKVLVIESFAGEECQLHVDNGRIIHALNGLLEGEEAFFQCMDFPEGKFFLKPWNEPTERTIELPADLLLFEAARRRDELN